MNGIRRTHWERVWTPPAILMAVGGLGYALLLDWVVLEQSLWNADEPILHWFAAHRSPALTGFFDAVSLIFGAMVLPVLVAVGAAVWGWRTGQWFNAIVVAGATGLAGLLALALKEVTARPRPGRELWWDPEGVRTYSFPSGHTLCATTLVLVTGYLAWRTDRHARVLVGWAVGSLLLAGIVAVSRLYLGYHFLTDVLAGACVGVFVLGVAAGVVRSHDLRDALREAQPPADAEAAGEG